MPRSPSNSGGRRSSRRKPNFSCSVPIRHASRGFSPDASTSASWRWSVIGASLALLGPDMRASSWEAQDSLRHRRAACARRNAAFRSCIRIPRRARCRPPPPLAASDQPPGRNRMRTILCAIALLFGFAARAHALEVERIEPANWWVGMVHHRVELMVHGAGIAATTPRIDRAGVTLVEVQRTDSQNYLFATVDVAADAALGEVAIGFLERGKVVATKAWRIDAREPGSAQRRGFGNADAIYLVTPTASPMAIRPTTASRACARPRTARTRTAATAATSPASAGTSTTSRRWASPSCGSRRCWRTTCRSIPTTATRSPTCTAPTRAWVRTTITARCRARAKAQGIGLVMDVVLNHIGSGHWWMRDLPARDWINHPGRYVETNDRRTTIQDPHAAPRTARSSCRAGSRGDARPQPAQPAPRALPHPEQPLVDRNRRPVRHPRGHLRLRRCRFLSAWGKAILDEYPGFSMVGEEWSLNPRSWRTGSAASPIRTGTCRTCRA